MRNHHNPDDAQWSYHVTGAVPNAPESYFVQAWYNFA
jgi:hypothetical protein